MKNFKLIAGILLMIAFLAPGAMAANEPTALNASAIHTYSIDWQWTANPTQYNTSVYIDGVFETNVTSPTTGTQVYTGTGFLPSTSHTISLESPDMNGTYSGWVNDTETTSASSVDFSGISSVISATVTQVLPGIVQLVVGIVTILVTLAVVGLIMGIFGSIVGAFKKGF
ncbi:Uncharacterised protein [uncultured archaeon]|nr:Uncharacterised protein [uncultured archaeon]